MQRRGAGGRIGDGGAVGSQYRGVHRMNEELERKAFEKWYLAQWKGQWSFAKNKTIADVEKLRGEDGDYSDYPNTNCCWLGWQARAKQESNDAH